MKAKRFVIERLIPALAVFAINLVWLFIVSCVLLGAVFIVLSLLSSTPFPFEIFWPYVILFTVGGSIIGFLRELE